MATNTIENIYIHYRTTSEFSSDAVIDFFTRNSILFNNLTKFTDKEELKLYAELMCQNLNALYHKGRYSEIVATAEKNIRFVNTKIVRLNLVAFINEWYSGILFLKAMALYKLKNYKVSTKIFRQLTNEDKRNENYKNWLSYSLYGQRMRISRTIAVLCGLLILIEIFFKNYIPSFFVRISLHSVALIGLIGTLIYDYYIKRSFKKIKIK